MWYETTRRSIAHQVVLAANWSEQAAGSASRAAEHVVVHVGFVPRLQCTHDSTGGFQGERTCVHDGRLPIASRAATTTHHTAMTGDAEPQVTDAHRCSCIASDSGGAAD